MEIMIRMTHRAPVLINTDEWEPIAATESSEGLLVIRRDKLGNLLVYGEYPESGEYGGYLVKDTRELGRHVDRVAVEAGMPAKMVMDLFASMEPEPLPPPETSD